MAVGLLPAPPYRRCVSSTLGITRTEDLPQAARDYIKRLDALMGAPVVMVSTGPEREATIMVTPIIDA